MGKKTEHAKLRDRRHKVGVSLETLAGLIGVRAATLSRWETGKHKPHAVIAGIWRAKLAQLEVEGGG